MIVNNAKPRNLKEYAPPCASCELIRLCKLTLPVSYSYLQINYVLVYAMQGN